MIRRYSHLSSEYMSRAVGTLDSLFAEALPAAEEPAEAGGGLVSGVTRALPYPDHAWANSNKAIVLLAFPMGFQPVLPP